MALPSGVVTAGPFRPEGTLELGTFFEGTGCGTMTVGLDWPYEDGEAAIRAATARVMRNSFEVRNRMMLLQRAGRGQLPASVYPNSVKGTRVGPNDGALRHTRPMDSVCYHLRSA